MSTDGLHRMVTVKCKSDYCETLVTTNVGAAMQGKYCDSCRVEVHRQQDRDSYWRDPDRARTRKRASEAERRKLDP